MKKFIELKKLKPGDQVAVISPAGDAAARFPWVYELGITRLKEEFGLEPKEYPSTLKLAASHEDKAKDLIAAFSDPNNKAAFATIGGFDQIQMLKLLDSSIFVDNPKPFFGSSDNTQLVNFLWRYGIPSYYCGSIMPQLAFPGAMPDLSIEYLKHAIFDEGEYEIKSSNEFNEETTDWSDEENWSVARKMEPNEGWIWDVKNDAKGILWGGCLESMVVIFSSGINIPKDDELDDCILFLETSEEIPQPWSIAYVLMGMGERGWFDRFKAVLIGRPKAWHINNRMTIVEKKKYRQEHGETIQKTIRYYNKNIPIVQNMDFGHTDPQIAVPSGKNARIDSNDRKIYFEY